MLNNNIDVYKKIKKKVFFKKHTRKEVFNKKAKSVRTSSIDSPSRTTWVLNIIVGIILWNIIGVIYLLGNRVEI